MVKDLAELGCKEFTTLGGEFLLRPDWYEVARAVKDEGMEIQLITNGLLVTEKIRKRFRSLNPQTVGVGIDGATPESYRRARGVDGFEKCRRLLFDLVDEGFRQVSAITTFNAKNLGDFDTFANMFLDTPIVWQVQMAHKGGERFPDDLLMNREQYKWFTEKAMDWLCDYNGRLKLMAMDDLGYFRNKSAQLTGKSAKCPFGEICKAGCSAMAISQTGTITETPFCIRQLEQKRITKEVTR